MPSSYSDVGSKKKRVVASRKKKPCRPAAPAILLKSKNPEQRTKYEAKFTEEDISEAAKLFREEEYSCASACEVTDDQWWAKFRQSGLPIMIR